MSELLLINDISDQQNNMDFWHTKRQQRKEIYLHLEFDQCVRGVL